MRRPVALAMFVVGVLALGGCAGVPGSTTSGGDGATYAMEACGITEASDGSGLQRTTPAGEWFLTDSLEKLRGIEDNVRERATAAQAASQSDARWDDLAQALTYNLTFISRVVDLRARGVVLNEQYLRANWPEHWDEGQQYNSNLQEFDVICGGLMRSLEDGS